MFVRVRQVKFWIGSDKMPFPMRRYVFDVVESRRVAGKGPRQRHIASLGAFTDFDVAGGQKNLLTLITQGYRALLTAEEAGKIPDYEIDRLSNQLYAKAQPLIMAIEAEWRAAREQAREQASKEKPPNL